MQQEFGTLYFFEEITKEKIVIPIILLRPLSYKTINYNTSIFKNQITIYHFQQQQEICVQRITQVSLLYSGIQKLLSYK